jgi:hypothetical protein
MRNPVRLADYAFFLGFGGVMYAILAGDWHYGGARFPITIAAMIVGSILVIGSFAYLAKRKREENRDE